MKAIVAALSIMIVPLGCEQGALVPEATPAQLYLQAGEEPPQTETAELLEFTKRFLGRLEELSQATIETDSSRKGEPHETRK